MKGIAKSLVKYKDNFLKKRKIIAIGFSYNASNLYGFPKIRKPK